ncbi:DUF2889 domain-containing protein [Kiloniella sp. EL199]|uniref:DUF2889 domain-containing protein n=1 Tax=Kiloniella sp. EL199 TaxID=2107581 RepID=UPI000EA3E7BE|nr:DUF2889 domain-containing protein [Kiloniella sp. EL199]
MPLPPAKKRKHLHQRRYDFQGYEREDNLWDIEGRITDVKSYPFDNQFRGTIEPGEALHDMWIRLTVDINFIVQDVEACIDDSPYSICPSITPNFKRIIGLKIGPGWRNAIRQTVGGTEGCTHLVEMLGTMATVTFQTLYPAMIRNQAKTRNEKKPLRRPGIIGTCHAYSSDGEIVKHEWPDFYTGSS